MRDDLGEDGLLSDDTRPLLVVSENSRSYRAVNKAGKRLLCYRVDSDMPGSSSRRRCDYAIGVLANKPAEPADETLYLVELKGSDLQHAASQILATLEELKPRIKNRTVRARIVLSRVARPDVQSSSVIALKRKLLAYRGDMRNACKVMEEVV